MGNLDTDSEEKGSNWRQATWAGVRQTTGTEIISEQTRYEAGKA